MLSGNNGYQLPWETLTCEETFEHIWTKTVMRVMSPVPTAKRFSLIGWRVFLRMQKEVWTRLNNQQRLRMREHIFPKRTCTEQMWSTVALIKTNYCINYFIHFLQFPFFCRSSARFQTTQWWLKVWVKQLSSTFLDSLNAFTVIRGISFPSLAISAVRGELGIMSWGESWGRGICKRQTWGSPIGQKCFGCWR